MKYHFIINNDKLILPRAYLGTEKVPSRKFMSSRFHLILILPNWREFLPCSGTANFRIAEIVLVFG